MSAPPRRRASASRSDGERRRHGDVSGAGDLRQSHAISLIAIVTVALCAALPAVATSQPGDPARFESDPIRGGHKLVATNFKLTPKWDRVRLLILDGTEMKASELSEWVKWANGLQSFPVIERLLAINTRVNKEFKYASDRKIWGKPDYWAEPVEAADKMRMDCEDYAIFKLFLGHLAGIQDNDLAIAVGKIPSTGEHHAIMFGVDAGTIYVLDNRSRYLRDTATYSDFQVLYSVDFDDVWLYPAAFQKKGD
jgi:predicted transglutaminase-like cysteine proteinase